MSVTRVILDPKRVGESITPNIDFIGKMNALAVGELISSVNSIVVTVWSGVDPNPSVVYSGTVVISPPSIITPTFVGGIAGVIYLIQMQVVVGSRILELDALLAVLPVGM